jgi:uncharacterized protein
MPATLSYPGVYIEEIPSGVHSITGVATSITAFAGRAWKGPLNTPVTITSYADYIRQFGGLWRESSMSYAVQQFFLNGGGQAIIVRVATAGASNTATPASFIPNHGLSLEAANPGTWGRNLEVSIDFNTKPGSPGNVFNLTVFDNPATKKDAAGRGGSGVREKFLNVSMDSTSTRYVETVLQQQSSLVRAPGTGTAAPAPGLALADATSGDDGAVIGDNDVTGILPVLEGVDLFNLLCIPPLTVGAAGTDVSLTTWGLAAALCEKKRALLIVDAPKAWTISTVDTAVPTLSSFSGIVRKNAAIYFPRLLISDPLLDGNIDEFAACGVIAGLMSRTDGARGVWKAPAGTEATLRGILGLTITMTDPENGLLNPLAINCLRTFPGIGTVCWGARTMEGQDILASEWKYVPIRRLALFLEESLFRGTKWVVFEPNDEPLWAQIRMNVGAFMMRLFRQGAFQGGTPDKAFYVKCDAETTPQSDRDLGIVNIEVGFAPLKPAEFVVIKIQQMAGDLE